MRRVHLISLGCPKNQVDSEGLLKKLSDRNIHYVSDPEDAAVILINTCGFISAAKKESVEEILKAAELKSGAGQKKLVVYGCLAKRYGEELRKEIPEIDALWGVSDEDAIAEYCDAVLGTSVDTAGPEKFFDKPYAYLKIAEGCDRGCSYCVIPSIRGKYRSLKPEAIISTAEDMVRCGTRELIVVAQDITAYGADLRGYDLPRLIHDLNALKGDFWIRLLYLYPTAVNDRLLETIAGSRKVCNYIDMPLQHTERNILKLMGRGGSRTLFERIIRRAREIIPAVALRTTFIVGFPQETAADFRNLVGFARKMKFDRLGAFTYSKEEGTPAAVLKGQVPERTRNSRLDMLMKAQAPISLSANREMVGRSLRALVDETEDGIAVCRLYSQAPEIDGVVIVRDATIAAGDFIEVRIDNASDYDLEGTVIR